MMNRLWTIVLVALLSPVLSRVVVSPVERMAQDCVAGDEGLMATLPPRPTLVVA